MKWRIALCLIILGSLVGICLPVFRSSIPALAAIPEYGAPTELDGSPLGGSTGYTTIYSAATSDYVVSTASALKTALASATSGKVVYIADGCTITITSANWYGYPSGSTIACGVYVKAGVTLAAGRGTPGVTGGILTVDATLQPTSFTALVWCGGSGAKITGLTLKGVQSGTTGGNMWLGIWTEDNAEVHNNEIYNFGYGGVRVDRNITNVWIHHNYIHHTRGTGYGYGVVVNAYSIYYVSSAIIEGNIIDYCRHFISGSRGRSSYILRYNYFGQNCTNTQLDVHGQNSPGYDDKDGSEYIYCAGDNTQIYNNTSICVTNPFVGIRGIPYSAGEVVVRNNWTYTTEADRWHIDDLNPSVCTINEQMTNLSGYGYDAPNGGAYVRMSVYDNWYGEDPPPNEPTPPPDYGYSVNSLPVLSEHIASNCANLRGFVGGPFDNQTTSAVGFVWDTVSRANPGDVACNATDYANSWTYIHVYSDNTTVEYVAENLTPNTIYYMRFAVHWNPWNYGEEVSFTTSGLGCTVIEALTTGADSESEIIGSDNQSFESIQISDNALVNYVYLRIYGVNSPTDLHVSLYNENTTTFVPEGAALASGDYDVSSITTDNTGEWIAIPLDATVSVTAGLFYDLVVTQDEASPDSIIWITTTTDGPSGYYAYSTDNGATWTYDAVTFRDGLYELRYCDFTMPGTPEFLHIINITETTVTLSWQEQEEVTPYYRMVYSTSDFPTNPFDGTIVDVTQLTSATASGLSPGTTYYFGVWSYDGVLYSTDGSFVAATTSAGNVLPTGTTYVDDTTPTILAASPVGGFISFVSTYASMPAASVGLLGYSSIFVFILVAVACYNRSTFLVIGLSIVGLALGNGLGVYSVVFLVIAAVVGITIGVLRGGQPTGG